MFLATKVLMNGEYTCGSTGLIFSGTFPYIISTIVTVIKIAVPILLIIFGMLDLGKAVVAAKEDEIDSYKGQGTQIAIDGYSFKIFVYKGTERQEAYNSGSLSGGKEEKIIIDEAYVRERFKETIE